MGESVARITTQTLLIENNEPWKWIVRSNETRHNSNFGSAKTAHTIVVAHRNRCESFSKIKQKSSIHRREYNAAPGAPFYLNVLTICLYQLENLSSLDQKPRWIRSGWRNFCTVNAVDSRRHWCKMVMGSDDTRIITSLIPNDVIYCYTKATPSHHCASNAVQNSNLNIFFIQNCVARVGLLKTQINFCHTPHQSASIFFLFNSSEHASPCMARGASLHVSIKTKNLIKFLFFSLHFFRKKNSKSWHKSWIPAFSTCDKWIGAVSNFNKIIHTKLSWKWRETRKVWQFYCTFTT